MRDRFFGDTARFLVLMVILLLGFSLTERAEAVSTLKHVYAGGQEVFCEPLVDVDAAAKRAAVLLAGGAEDAVLVSTVSWEESGFCGETLLDEDGLVAFLTQEVSLSVRYTREQTVFEEQDFETVFLENEDKYIDERVVLLPGEKGEARVTKRLTCVDGTVIAEETLRREVIREPSDRVIYIGTKKREPAPDFIQPVKGRLTSDYGRRKGEFHTGIDIAVDRGTAICAAADGTVIFAGWKGNYGYYVQIEHEDGIVTGYAHNTRLTVRKGDTVRQGQQIALAGMTGRANGYHCHFEVLIDNKFQDPHEFVDFEFTNA